MITFLLSEWSGNKYVAELHGRQLFFVSKISCILLTSASSDSDRSCQVHSLSSYQEETDTRLLLHCLHATQIAEHDQYIIVRSPDTGVFFLLLHYANRILQNLIFDTGEENKRPLFDVKNIAAKIGKP